MNFSFLFIYRAGVEPRSLILRKCIGLLFQVWIIDDDCCEEISGMNEWQRKPKYVDETYPSNAVSTTVPT
jgi:hypothetical protein